MTTKTFLLTTMFIAAGACAHEEPTMTTASTPTTKPPTTPAPRSGHAPIRGVNYYYEIRGAGEPLLLLHGGLGSLDMFDPILPILTKTRQVILVDLHGHGRTPRHDQSDRSGR